MQTWPVFIMQMTSEDGHEPECESCDIMIDCVVWRCVSL